MYLQFLIFSIAVSPLSGSLGVGFLALQTAIDFLLDLALREFLPTLGADFRNALRGFHVLHISLNRWVVSVYCHVLTIARPGLLGGYGAQGEIVRFLAHGSHSFIFRHSSMMFLTIVRIHHTKVVARTAHKSKSKRITIILATYVSPFSVAAKIVTINLIRGHALLIWPMIAIPKWRSSFVGGVLAYFLK